MRFPALDGLRALAAFFVVVSHFSNETQIWGGLLGTGGGQLGVMIFFLISGFLMARLYMDGPWNAAEVGAFLQKRVARVVPLYLVVVLVSAAAHAWLGAASPLYPITRENLLRHLLFWDGVLVLWTIPVEIHFYLLFPAIWALYAKVGSRWTIAVLLAIGVVLFVSPRSGVPLHTLAHHLPYFLLGIVVAIASPRGSPSGAKPGWDAAFVAALALTVLCMPKLLRALSGMELGPLWKSPLPVFVLTGLLWSSLQSPLANRVLGGRLGRFFGDISYSVYLLHMPVLRIASSVEPLDRNPWLLLVAFFTALTALSYLSYRLLEFPARRAINSVSLRAIAE